MSSSTQLLGLVIDWQHRNRSEVLPVHRASLLGRGYPDPQLDPQPLRLRRALTFSLFSAILPGSVQFIAGNRAAKVIVGLVWLVVLAGLGIAGYFYFEDQPSFVAFFASTRQMVYIQIGIITVATLWAIALIDAWRLGMQGSWHWLRAATIILANVSLIAAGATVTVVGVQALDASQRLVKEVFTATETVKPMLGRYNVLLLGGDSGEGRVGLRPDSLTVVSIDSESGRTALIGIPRNLQKVPFNPDSPMHNAWPNGFNCGNPCLINAVNTWADSRPELYPGSENPGLEATIDAVEGATGLTINYYIMVNLAGFRKLVNAVGGLELNVKDRVPIGGGTYPIVGYIEPGLQKLDGRQVLWFARSRENSDDYSRMGRQKCVMLAMARQLTPATVLLKAQGIAASSSEMLSTSIPASELDIFVELALRSRSAKVNSVSLVPPVINPSNPDFVKAHSLIKDAIAQTESDDISPSPNISGSPSPSPSKSLTPMQRAKLSNNVDDLAEVC